MDLEHMVVDMCQAAKTAARGLATTSSQAKNEALLNLRSHCDGRAKHSWPPTPRTLRPAAATACLRPCWIV